MSRSSNFLNLPRELRDMVYGYLPGNKRNDGHLVFLTQLQSPMFGTSELFKRSWREVSAVLAVNRQIHSEVQDMLYRDEYFHVQANWCRFGAFNRRSWIQTDRIQRLILCISLPGDGGVFDFGDCNQRNSPENLLELGWKYRCVDLQFLEKMKSLSHVKLIVHYRVRNSICDICDIISLGNLPSFQHMVDQIASCIPRHVEMSFGIENTVIDMSWITYLGQDRLFDDHVLREVVDAAKLSNVASEMPSGQD